MRLSRLVLLAPFALALAACGSDAEADAPGPDFAACDSAHENGGLVAIGVPDAAEKLLADLGDAGPDDNYSEDVSGYLQILAADAQLIVSGADAPNTSDHVDDALAACEDIGWEAPE